LVRVGDWGLVVEMVNRLDKPRKSRVWLVRVRNGSSREGARQIQIFGDETIAQVSKERVKEDKFLGG
jgi:hypothetical protein